MPARGRLYLYEPICPSPISSPLPHDIADMDTFALAPHALMTYSAAIALLSNAAGAIAFRSTVHLGGRFASHVAAISTRTFESIVTGHRKADDAQTFAFDSAAGTYESRPTLPLAVCTLIATYSLHLITHSYTRVGLPSYKAKTARHLRRPVLSMASRASIAASKAPASIGRCARPSACRKCSRAAMGAHFPRHLFWK